jgi:hypothetical protein
LNGRDGLVPVNRRSARVRRASFALSLFWNSCCAAAISPRERFSLRRISVSTDNSLGGGLFKTRF